MIGVAKFVVGSGVSVAGTMLNITFRNIDRMYGALGAALEMMRETFVETSHRARHFAEHPDAYANDAEESTEAWAQDVANSATDKVEQVAAAARAIVDDEDAGRRPYEERTKAELYELATERDLQGRSTMNKQELIGALREARS